MNNAAAAAYEPPRDPRETIDESSIAENQARALENDGAYADDDGDDEEPARHCEDELHTLMDKRLEAK